MKKIVVLLTFLMVMLLFAACATGEAEYTADSNEDSFEEDSMDSNNEEDNSSNENNEDASDTDGAVPKGYPEDLVPIMDGSRIFAGGSENLDNEKASVWVKLLSPGEPEEVAAFYRDILSGASDMKDEQLGGIYFLEGTLEGKAVAMKITEQTFEDGFPTSTLIEISGIDSVEKEKSSTSSDIGKANTGLINEDKIPSGYNKDLVPIVGGSEINKADEMEYNGNTAYVLVCYSKEEKEEVLKFYKEVMENAKDKEEGTLSTGSYYLNGSLDNAKIYLVIGDEDVHDKYKSFYNMTVEMLGQ